MLKVRKDQETRQIKFYRRFGIFDEFNEKILTVMNLFAKEKNFYKGNTIIDFGQRVDGIYLIKSGTIKVRNFLEI